MSDHIMNECMWIKCPCSSGEDTLFKVSIKVYPISVLLLENIFRKQVKSTVNTYRILPY